jgi:hypothetical protein
MSLDGRRRRARALAAAAVALTFALAATEPAMASDSTSPAAQAPPGGPTARAAPAGPAGPVAAAGPIAPAEPIAPAQPGTTAPGTFALPGTLTPPAATEGPANCLTSGDGYLRARVAGALETRVNWSNSGMRCQGEARDAPPGVRLSFQRPGGKPDLLFVFGLTGVREGRPAHAVATNLTLIVQGTDRIYGTLGDSRCTVDSLSQRRLGSGKNYRLEARGFCTQPAHAVRGEGVVLVSTFEFAGIVNYEGSQDAAETARANP